MDFAETLHQLRTSCCWTQQELGKMLGKSKNNISQYETGKREPDLTTLIRLAELFHVSLERLLGLPDYPSQLNNTGSLLFEESSPVRLLSVYTDAHAALQSDACGYRAAAGEELGNGEYFYFIAQDQSMVGARIHEGDYLLIRRDTHPLVRGINLCLYEGRTCLRYLTPHGEDGLLMLSGSLDYPPMLASGKSLRVLGSVVRVEFTPDLIGQEA